MDFLGFHSDTPRYTLHLGRQGATAWTPSKVDNHFVGFRHGASGNDSKVRGGVRL